MIAWDSIPDNAQTWDDTTLPVSNGLLQHLVLYRISNGLLKLKLIALLWCKDAECHSLWSKEIPSVVRFRKNMISYLFDESYKN